LFRQVREGGTTERLVPLREQLPERGAMLLRLGAIGVSSDRGVDALVGKLVVVLPDSYHLRVLGLPAPHKPSAMAELNWQEVVVEDRKPFRHCGVTADAIEHPRTIVPSAWGSVASGSRRER
jgi:hypothetical protein